MAKFFVLCILFVESMYLKAVLGLKISNHNLVLRNHDHGSQSHFCPNPIFELVGVAISAEGIICTSLLLFGLTNIIRPN